MTTVDKDRLLEMKPHRFTADASELGFRPGHFPEQFTVLPKFGNGLDFKLYEVLCDRNGDVSSIQYAQIYGCITITVFND